MPRVRARQAPTLAPTVEQLLRDTRDDVTFLRDAFDWHSLQRSDGRISPEASAAVSRLCQRAVTSLTAIVQALPVTSLNLTPAAPPPNADDI